MMRHIDIEGSWNVRDLGGYPTRDGRTTRWRSVLRAGNLDKVSAAGQQSLLDYGVKTIIDLRDVSEVRDYPNVFVESRRVRYYHLPVYETDAFPDSTLPEMYCGFIGTCQPNIGAIIAAVAEGEPGILVHCFAGKDRTGIVSALLLGVVGVPDEVIAEDYALTSGRINHLFDSWRTWATAQGHDMERFEHQISSEAATMLATLEFIDRQYGGIISYLQASGVTDEQISRLQTLMLE